MGICKSGIPDSSGSNRVGSDCHPAGNGWISTLNSLTTPACQEHAIGRSAAVCPDCSDTIVPVEIFKDRTYIQRVASGDDCPNRIFLQIVPLLHRDCRRTERNETTEIWPSPECFSASDLSFAVYYYHPWSEILFARFRGLNISWCSGSTSIGWGSQYRGAAKNNRIRIPSCCKRIIQVGFHRETGYTP
jgi:hypothetical protein